MGLFDKEQKTKTKTTETGKASSNTANTGATTNTGTVTTDIPDYVTQAGQQLLNLAGTAATTPVSYDGQRVADFTPDQLAYFANVRDYANSADPGIAEEAIRGANSYASAPAQNVATERVVDENGRLGAISDYMNPYTEEALQPAIRELLRVADQQRQHISSMADTAGAFGDARHGILEARNNADTSTAVGDTASKFYMDAFERAMGLRSGDLARMLDVDKTNANYNERALDRLLAGTGASQQRYEVGNADTLQRLHELLGAGTLQQANEQSKYDAAYDQFWKEYLANEQNMLNYSNILQGIPYDKSITTTGTGTTSGTGTSAGTTSGTRNTVETQPDNSIWQLLGTLGGAALAPVTAGGSVAGASLLGALSDRRAKTDISQVGSLDNGLPVYLFRYKAGGPFQIGLMADDVEGLAPEAVSEMNGLKMVNYAIAAQAQ